MGLFSMFESVFGSKKKSRVLVVGLDNSGKTTIINHLKPKKVASAGAEITPTVGFQVEEFAKNNINFTMYDMSGQSRYRSLWEHYYNDVQAIIFVLDSTDRLRLCVAKEELQQLLSHDDIRKTRAPVLFFANKMDVSGAVTPEEIMDELELDKIRDKPWHIQQSNAVTGSGVDEGVEWLCTAIGSTSGKRK